MNVYYMKLLIFWIIMNGFFIFVFWYLRWIFWLLGYYVIMDNKLCDRIVFMERVFFRLICIKLLLVLNYMLLIMLLKGGMYLEIYIIEKEYIEFYFLCDLW